MKSFQLGIFQKIPQLNFLLKVSGILPEIFRPFATPHYIQLIFPHVIKIIKMFARTW